MKKEIRYLQMIVGQMEYLKFRIQTGFLSSYKIFLLLGLFKRIFKRNHIQIMFQITFYLSLAENVDLENAVVDPRASF